LNENRPGEKAMLGMRVGMTSAIAVACLLVTPTRASPAESDGFIVYSILNDAKFIFNVNLYIFKIHGFSLQVLPSRTLPKDYNIDGGILEVRRMSPGSYELRKIQVLTPDFRSAQPRVSVRFNVESNKATYIGRLTPHFLMQNTYFAGPAVRGFGYTVSDESQQDMPLAASKLPAGIEVQIAAPPTEPGEIGKN
jgi:hypothetical protein